MPGRLELYGARSCPFTLELREKLEWDGRDFADYDVEVDESALARLAALTPGPLTVPVLVEDGRVVQIGWQGRGCGVAPPTGSADES
jgi:mycoredoxin